MRVKSKERRKVAIFIETSTDYCRRMLAGIDRFLQNNKNWSVYLDQSIQDGHSIGWITAHKWDGILYRHSDRAIKRTLLTNSVPAVILTDMHEVPNYTVVVSDHQSIGSLGAQHLKKCGMRHFAFCGFTGRNWSDFRKESFCNAVAKFGCQAAVWESPMLSQSSRHWGEDMEALRRWIDSLPKPIGIMAANDTRALHVMKGCEELGLVMPDQVAVIGVDNEETHCKFSKPPITSILPDCEQIGVQAAQRLDDMMSGSRVEAKRIEISGSVKMFL